jgi:hypothetical protein
MPGRSRPLLLDALGGLGGGDEEAGGAGGEEDGTPLLSPESDGCVRACFACVQAHSGARTDGLTACRRTHAHACTHAR